MSARPCRVCASGDLNAAQLDPFDHDEHCSVSPVDWHACWDSDATVPYDDKYGFDLEESSPKENQQQLPSFWAAPDPRNTWKDETTGGDGSSENPFIFDPIVTKGAGSKETLLSSQQQAKTGCH